MSIEKLMMTANHHANTMTMDSDWTLRVPVKRPYWVVGVDYVCELLAVIGVALALYWQNFSLISPVGILFVSIGIGVGIGVMQYRCALSPWRARVSGMLVTRSGAFYVRLNGIWRPVILCDRWRGWRWLTLQIRLPVSLDQGRLFFRHTVTFTIWQDALRAAAWRRVCLLTARRLEGVFVGRFIKTAEIQQQNQTLSG